MPFIIGVSSKYQVFIYDNIDLNDIITVDLDENIIEGNDTEEIEGLFEV